MAAASHAYTFPPFPTPPPGVQITPFADFRENGIQVFSPDGKIEVDGLGIPTVELSSKHDSDEGKTEARPKKSITSIQPRTVVNADGTKSKRLPDWYEAWAETESSRICSYDQCVSSILIPLLPMIMRYIQKITQNRPSPRC